MNYSHTLRPVVIDELMHDPSVRDILINDARTVAIDDGAGLRLIGTTTEAETRAFIEREVRTSGRRIDRTSPIVDARLADGSRLCAVVAPVAVGGTCVAVRRFTLPRVDVAAFGGDALADVARELVQRRCNVIVTGAAGAGKTTFTNALCNEIPHGERIVTIEDTAELRLDHPHIVSLEAQPPNIEGRGAVPLSMLLRTALRLRPDRLVVGEVRGPEVVDMLAAMNTGHLGSISTCHANGPLDATRRLESLVLQYAPSWTPDGAREHIRAALDVCIHVVKRADGSRAVANVVELPLTNHHQFVELYRDGLRVAPLTRGEAP